MSNGIAKRQNDEKAITMLAAQRQLYNSAKNFNAISIIVSVWLPFAMSVILLILPGESNLKIASYMLAIGSILFSYVVDNRINDKKKLAASIQQQFDIYVYNMPWNERIFGKEKNLNGDIVFYSKNILGNDDEKNSLYNWYTTTVDNKELCSGILLCQRENCNWDVGLRKRYRFLSIIMIVFLCSFVLVMGLYKNENVATLLWRLAFIVPMLRWLLDLVKKLNKDMARLKELFEIVNNNETKTMDELQDIQRLIGEHRKECYVIPNLIYKIFKDNDEDMARRVISMEK